MDQNSKVGRYLTLKECCKSETAIRRGIDNTPDEAALFAMNKLCFFVYDLLCDYFKFKLPITSFYRSYKLNKAIGGAAKSQHTKGEAVDIDVDSSGSGVTNSAIFHYILNSRIPFDQLIWEYGDDQNPSWVHVSYSQSYNRHQVLRAVKENGKTTYKPYE